MRESPIKWHQFYTMTTTTSLRTYGSAQTCFPYGEEPGGWCYHVGEASSSQALINHVNQDVYNYKYMPIIKSNMQFCTPTIRHFISWRIYWHLLIKCIISGVYWLSWRRHSWISVISLPSINSNQIYPIHPTYDNIHKQQLEYTIKLLAILILISYPVLVLRS